MSRTQAPDRDESPPTTRRQFLTRAGAFGAMPMLSPASLFGEGVFTPAALSNPDEAITHGDGTPSWYVSLDDADSMDSLRDWVGPDTDNDREIIHEHAWDAMTIRAPAADVGRQALAGHGWASGGLQSRSWVSTVDRNLGVGLPEPVTLESQSDAWDFGFGTLDGWVFGLSEPEPDGVAFDEDAEETVMADHLRATGADSVTADTSGLTIAVVDTGVNDGDVFEDSNGDTRILDTSKNFITDETGVSAVEDGNSHGTWVASCIAARAPTDEKSDHEGFAPDADVLALKAMGDGGSGSTANIAAAIEYAADQGADVMCLSLGSPLWSEQLNDALAYAVDQGTVPVAAAGNDRVGSIWAATPSDSEHAIGVSATTAHSDPDERLSAYFANVGPDPGTADMSDGESNGATPDLAAPGMETTVLAPTPTRSEGQSDTKSGTSMAAPMVAGCAMLLLASEGSMDFESVRDRLTEYHDPLPKVAENEAAYGGVNAQRAIDQDAPDEPHADSMTDEAETRSAAYEQLSNAQGGRIYKWLA